MSKTENKADMSGFQPFEISDNSDARRIATATVVDKVSQVMFYFFSENEEGIEDDQGALEEFADYTWAIACSAVNAIGLRIVGVDQDGNYIAKLKPHESVKDYLMTRDIGQEDDFYYEDAMEPAEYEDSGFTVHEKDLLGE